jgi:ribosomal protein S18 acetylase RimI-like enzyme
MSLYRFEWRGDFDNATLNALHAEAFAHTPDTHDWVSQVRSHSLEWVCAYNGEALVGFVNVAWDGALHAFILDAAVATSAQRHGIGTDLVREAAAKAADAGCIWLHVDFEDALKSFYFTACGFIPANAGLVSLRR